MDGKWTNSNPPTIIMNTAHTAEAIYEKSDLGGKIIVDAIPRITEIIVDGTIYLPNELPLSFSWIAGSTHTLDIQPFVQKDFQTRYRFDSWKDLNEESLRTITVTDDAVDFIALYKVQHQLKPISEHSNVIGAGWHDEGTSVNFEVESSTVYYDSEPNTRYVFDSWSTGDYQNSESNSIDLVQPTTVKANWNKQYLVNVTSNMPDYIPFGGGWFNEGTNLPLIAEDDLDSITSDTKYTFSRWQSAGQNALVVSHPQSSATNVIVNQPLSIEAHYEKAHLINVFTPYGTAVGSGFYEHGKTAQLSIQDTQIEMEPKKVRKIFAGWDTAGARVVGGQTESANQNLMIYVDRPMDITAEWKTQYYLQVKSSQATASGEGWHDAGKQVKVSVKSPTEPASMWSAYNFDGWSGDITSDSTTTKLIMNEPKTVIAEWEEDPTPGIINGFVLGFIGIVGVAIFKKARHQEKLFNEGKIGIENKSKKKSHNKSRIYSASKLGKIKNMFSRNGNGNKFNNLFSKPSPYDPNYIFDEEDGKINSSFFRIKKSDK